MPKSTGKHKHNRLSDIQIRKLTKKGRYGDGLCLYLEVTALGSKQWLLRTTVNGERINMGLGGYPTVPLAEARQKAMEYRCLAKKGINPIDFRRQSNRIIPTFEEAARKVHANNIPTWKETKAVDQWINSLENYAFPKIGAKKLNDIRPSDILSVLEPIWVEKHSTANRVRQRMSRVFDWAKTQEYIANENPVTGIKQGLVKVNSRVKHFKALPYEDISKFICTLKTSSQTANVKLGLEFLILTACRSGELRAAEWSEIDHHSRRWKIQAKRMKAGREHHVPLSNRAISILDEIKDISGNSKYIFPSSQNWKKSMSDATISKAVKTMGYEVTVHGFRSTFRDWASETRTYPNDVVEMALAHTNPNRIEAAYKRGDLFDKRIKIMDDWADYCDGKLNFNPIS